VRLACLFLSFPAVLLLFVVHLGGLYSSFGEQWLLWLFDYVLAAVERTPPESCSFCTPAHKTTCFPID